VTVRRRSVVLARFVAWVLVTLLVLTVAAVWLARTDWGRTRLAGIIADQASQFIDGELHIGRLEGSLYGGADLHDVTVTRNGETVLTAATISGSYRLRDLFSSAIVIENLVVTGARISLLESPETWYVDGLQLPDSDPNDPPSDTVIQLRSVEFIDGEARVRPIGREYDLVAIAGETGVLIADDITVDVRRLQAREALGGLQITSLTTRVLVTDDRITLAPVDLATSAGRMQGTFAMLDGGILESDLQSERLLLTELQPYVPALDGITLAPSMTLRLQGPLDALQVTGPVVDPTAGRAVVDIVTNLSDIFSVRGSAQLADFDVAPWAVRPDLPTRLNGDVTFDLTDDADARGLTGSFSTVLARSRYQEHIIDRARATGSLSLEGVKATFDAGAYGASSTGNVIYVFTTETTTVTGQLRNGDAARLPAFMNLPPLQSAVNGTYTLVMTPATFSIETTLDASTLEGATLEAGTTAAFTITNDTDVVYAVSGRVQDLDPKRMAPKLLDPTEPPLEWPVESVRVSGPITLEGAGAIAGELIDHRATFSGTLDADVDGAMLRRVVVDGALASRRLTMTAEGAASGSWDRLAQWEGGGIEPDGTFKMAVTVADLGAEMNPTFADGSMDVTLGPSRMNGVSLTSARIQATAAGGVVTITQGAAAGPLGAVAVSGTVALSDTGVSDLEYTVDIADLALLPAQLEVEATGQLHTKGQLTGPFRDPRMRGTLTASTLAAFDMSVLHADGTYDVSIPEFLFEKLTGSATADATFIEAGGQSWPRATLKATFDATTADVTASVEHERATIDFAAGITTLADDVVEMTARSFTLKMPGESWAMRDGATAILRMSADRLTIDRMELAKGDERIVMEGALPFTATAGQAAAQADQLRVEAVGVAVAPFVTTLLGEERVTGTLNGTATVTGAMDDPQVKGTFAITDGEADGVPFRSVGGTVGLVNGMASVDVKLDAAERGTASITGVAPIDPAATGINLAVSMQLTDVGVIAPVLVYVANATGAANADLKISGSQESLRIDGTAALTDVQFSVPETGVTYRRLNAGLRVDDSVLVVDRFTMEDADGHTLRVNGRLDVLARGSGGEVDLRIVAQQFRLLGNQFGDLSVNLDLTAAGTLTAPQVIGSVRIERGRFEVDELLQQFIPSSAYVGAAAPTKPPVAGEKSAAPVPPSVFSGAALSIDVILPDNVIVRGRGIQTDDGPIGLGDINLTLGGTLQVSKARGGEAGLFGQVSVVRGTYDFQGRRFAIERGSLLRFRGDDYTNPTIDINATREVSGVDVRVRLTGTAMSPTLTLSSQPSLDEGDILALVVFNRPINQLGTGERVSLAARAGSLAAGAVVGPLADSVARALDLDVFEIQTAEAGTVGATVTVGRQISDRLFVGFRHEFGGEGTNRLSFEYRLTEYLRLVTSFAPGAQPANRSARTEAAGIDLIFVIRR
jgi:autotransporter translocation and assembly factor TamB